MLDPSAIEAYLRQLPPEQLRTALAGFLPQNATAAERISAIETALLSPAGRSLRAAMARWIVEQSVPVEALVPKAYIKWRPPVRDAMTFVVSHLSAPRLAPKLLEQIELPPKTSPETRLLLLIAKVPGLQKLGQVIARNRHLGPALRNALAKLENGIRDVRPEDIIALIRQQLGRRIETFEVKIKPVILSEASVSAVVPFTWLDPDSGKRERGVFKVLKPHIPVCFAEDMDFLQELAQWFGAHHRDYGFPRQLIPDTFKKVRRLLQHEVNFVREQKTLVEARTLYLSMRGVRVPRLIEQLSTPAITAMSREHGVKVTNAAVHMSPVQRRKVAGQLIEALIAVPLLASDREAIFHGDPHAGNLLYDKQREELIIVDWALRERLSRDQRRHLALLFLIVGLRDPVGACAQVEALAQYPVRRNSREARVIRQTVTRLIDELPLTRLPSAADTVGLLEQIAMQGVRFPASLIMLSKVLLTLDGILQDVGGSAGRFSIIRHLAQHWLFHRAAFRSPVRPADMLTVQCSALLYGSRFWVQCEQAIVDRLLPRASDDSAVPA
jgi:ubiquinone biosynthesis protein